MSEAATFPSITAQIGGKSRRLILERHLRRAIENRELSRSSVVLLELGPDNAQTLPAGDVPMLQDLFLEILGPVAQAAPAAERGELVPAPEIANEDKPASKPVAQIAASASRPRKAPVLAPTDKRQAPDYRSFATPARPAVGSPVPEAESLVAYMLLPLKRYAEFTGRSRRKEFWAFQLLALLLTVLNAIIIASANDALMVLMTIAMLGLFIPGLAVAARRLHDRGHSGAWLVAIAIGYLVPVINVLTLVATIWVFALPGTQGPNRFGADPKAS